MSTAIVTGACGLIGTNLCHRLFQKGYSVIGIDNFLSGWRPNQIFLEQKALELKQTFRLIESDACQPWKELDLKTSVDLVFHLASLASPQKYLQFPLETVKANTFGLLQALEFATPQKARLIFASTSEIYGVSPVQPIPESYFGSVNSFSSRACYQESKRMGESLVQIFNEKCEGRHGVVRIFNTYGPHMNPEDSRVIPHFMRQAEKNERLNLHGDGFQTRSFCYVDDLVDQLWVYAKSSISQPMNLGHDQEVSILTVGQMILQLFDRPLDLLTFESQMPDEPHRRCPHLEFMRSQKENIIQIDLNEGLHKTARWWKDLKLREARA